VSTTYVIFCQSYDDPVWGEQIIDWINTGLVRVYRNGLRKAVFEYVGCPGLKFDLERVRRTYPICRFADIPEDPIMVQHRKHIPFPDRRHS
jgi:hypothetical protein